MLTYLKQTLFKNIEWLHANRSQVIDEGLDTILAPKICAIARLKFKAKVKLTLHWDRADRMVKVTLHWDRADRMVKVTLSPFYIIRVLHRYPV